MVRQHIAALLLLVAAAGAQQATPFVFHAATRLVQINVVVDGPKGPVTGLTAKDFTVTDNGAARVISVFSADHTQELVTGGAAAAVNAAPGQFTNAQPRTPNMVVVLFDALNSPDGTEYVDGHPGWSSSHSFVFAKQGALKFLRQIPPGASVALYALDTQLRVLSDFTRDHDQLVAALQAYQPPTQQSVDTGTKTIEGMPVLPESRASREFAREVAMSQQVEGTVPALRSISDHLAGIPGRISLVWIMTRPPMPGAEVEAALARDNVAVYPLDARGLMAWDLGLGDLNFRTYGAVMRTQPDGLEPLTVTDVKKHLPQYDDIAEATGGRAFYNTNGIAQALEAAAIDSESSYTLGFYVPAEALDNQFHAIRVHVRSKHLDPRYPHGYWALRNASDSAPQGAAAIAALLGDAERNPASATGLPVSASLAPSGSALQLRATIGITGLHMPDGNGQHSGAIVIETVDQDVTGAALDRSRHTLSWRWNDAQYQRMLRSGVEIEQAVAPAPGTVTLRVIAEDPASGAIGSVIIPLAAAAR